MTSRERVQRILSGQPVDRPAFWLGNPIDETKEIYYRHFGVGGEAEVISADFLKASQVKTNLSGRRDLELNLAVGSDMVWVSPELDAHSWKHPSGKPMWDFYNGGEKHSLTQPGFFADYEDPAAVEAFDWPDPANLDFSSTHRNVKEANEAGLAVFGGMWMPFFHIAADFFGMENYFVKMITHPEVVEAVTDRIIDFYLEANRRCLDLMSGELVAGFFGNDFGSQLDLLIAPDMMERFIMPYYKRLIDQIRSYGLKVVVHSCGSIDRIIPRLIEAGIEGLHPLQARAAHMDAENLAMKYRGKVAFIGGVDTQDLLPFGSVEEVRAEV
ncbi:MAG: uroporphyrinogen decarboxylase family protein, partial [Spirochaetota bacterium]